MLSYTTTDPLTTILNIADQLQDRAPISEPQVARLTQLSFEEEVQVPENSYYQFFASRSGNETFAKAELRVPRPTNVMASALLTLYPKAGVVVMAQAVQKRLNQLPDAQPPSPTGPEDPYVHRYTYKQVTLSFAFDSETDQMRYVVITPTP